MCITCAMLSTLENLSYWATIYMIEYQFGKMICSKCFRQTILQLFQSRKLKNWDLGNKGVWFSEYYMKLCIVRWWCCWWNMCENPLHAMDSHLLQLNQRIVHKLKWRFGLKPSIITTKNRLIARIVSFLMYRLVFLYVRRKKNTIPFLYASENICLMQQDANIL